MQTPQLAFYALIMIQIVQPALLQTAQHALQLTPWQQMPFPASPAPLTVHNVSLVQTQYAHLVPQVTFSTPMLQLVFSAHSTIQIVQHAIQQSVLHALQVTA